MVVLLGLNCPWYSMVFLENYANMFLKWRANISHVQNNSTLGYQTCNRLALLKVDGPICRSPLLLCQLNNDVFSCQAIVFQ